MAGVTAVIPKIQFSNSLGVPMISGTLEVYLAGTTTATPSYQDKALSIANTNPITLDSRGECLLWLNPSLTYKFVLKSNLGVAQWTVDDIAGAERAGLREILAASGGSATIGFLQSGAGAVARTAQSKARDFVSVKDFGAVGDGVADDTVAVQAALTAHKHVYIPAGTYLISTVTLSTGSVLHGAGETSILKQKLGGTFAMVSADSGSAVVASNLTGICVRDVQLLGTVAIDAFSQFIYLLGLNGVTNAIIERVLFKGFRGDGFYLGTSYVAGIARYNVNVIVRSCAFDGVNNDNRNAITVIDCDGMVIEDCSFVNCTRSTMPGAIDVEPNVDAFHIIKNIRIKKNRFANIGGNIGVISVYVPSTVTAAPTNITVEDNVSSGYVGTGAFFRFQAGRLPTATSVENDIKVLNNKASGGVLPFALFDGKRITVQGNTFTDFTREAQIGGTGVTDTVRDIECENNWLVRCGSTGAGIGLAIYNVYFLSFRQNKLVDCGTGVAGTAIGVDFTTGASTNVQFIENEISSPGGKTTVAIQKEAAHTASPLTTRLIANRLNGLPIGSTFLAGESDTIEQSYAPVIAGATTAGTGVYTIRYGIYRRHGNTVTFRVQLDVAAGHTGTGMIQISLPLAPRTSLNNELRPVPFGVDGAATTGGQVGMINPAAVVGGVTGAVRCYSTGTGVLAQTNIPAGAFTVWVNGSYEAA